MSFIDCYIYFAWSAHVWVIPCYDSGIFGDGSNYVSFTHMDNIAHGLLCASNALQSVDSPANGKFFVVTDGACHNLWDTINDAVVQCGYTALASKFHLTPVSHAARCGVCLLPAYLCGVEIWG
jgi:hypothetical protein